MKALLAAGAVAEHSHLALIEAPGLPVDERSQVEELVLVLLQVVHLREAVAEGAVEGVLGLAVGADAAVGVVGGVEALAAEARVALGHPGVGLARASDGGPALALTVVGDQE